MSTLRCSVVVPTRNDEAHLRLFLSALRLQTVAPDEVIIVDNDSSDDSATIAREWGATVVSESRVGIPFAAKTGYDAARGEIIVRADSDTRPDPQWLSLLLAHFDADESAVAVTGPGRFYGMPAPAARMLSELYVGSYVAATSLALAHPPLFGTNLAFRRSWWNSVSEEVHLSPDVHDDMDLSFRVRPHERVRYDRRIVVGMSPRPLRANSGIRWRRGIETVRKNWHREPPWERWSNRRGAIEQLAAP